MIKKIYQIGASCLTQKANIVEDVTSKSVAQVIDNLLETVKSVADRSAGLSANQIGENMSICIVRRVDLEEKLLRSQPDSKLSEDKLWKVLINPHIIRKSPKESYYWEGCLSVGEREEDTIFGPVLRSDSIEVQYTDRAGEQKILEANDFFAHVIQHELDHLAGELFITKVPNPDLNLKKSKEIEVHMKKYGDWPQIV